jgi:3-mercaptopyruvate sulfurtransferase SseA
MSYARADAHEIGNPHDLVICCVSRSPFLLIMTAKRFISAIVSFRPAALSGALIVLMLAGGCETNKPTDKSLSFVDVAEGERLVAGEKTLLQGHRSAAWVDARASADYDAGHIPGAISLPFERVSLEYDRLKDEPIVIIYGADYNDNRANGMAKRLRELMEDADIRILDGGVRAWTAAGNELETTNAGG